MESIKTMELNSYKTPYYLSHFYLQWYPL